VLSDQANAILETARHLVTLDRRDLDAAWHRAHSALEAAAALADAGRGPNGPSRPPLDGSSSVMPER
jgi:hypothetical protein